MALNLLSIVIASCIESYLPTHYLREVNIMKFFKSVFLLITILGLSLSGCGSGGSSSSDGLSTGLLSLHITDAPVDNASHVIVEFTGVEIQSSSGNRTNFDFSPPRQIDLLALHGGGSEVILDNVILTAGDYDWIRLKVNADCDVNDSYIEINNVIHSIWIPSGNQSGLKLVRGFHLPADGIADFTIDFDLRKSVNYPQGQGNCSGNYKLKPALRIVNNISAGSIAGNVNQALINDATCTGGNVVYVFQGLNISPDDVDGIIPDPITSAIVEVNNIGEYNYRASFLNAGDYTIAFTCQADSDTPETDDTIDFAGTTNVSVTAGLVTIHDF